MPATFTPINIKIEGATDYPRNLNIVIEKLKKAGIKFFEKKIIKQISAEFNSALICLDSNFCFYIPYRFRIFKI